LAKHLYLESYPSFGSLDKEALRKLIRRIDKPCRRFLEVGSWLGTGSTQVFIEEIRDGSGELFCIDTWQGSPNTPRHQEIIKGHDVFQTFEHNVEQASGTECVTPISEESTKAALRFEDKSFDLIFIDGDHSHTQTMADIRAWLPKVRPGGILCGHDCEARVTNENREFLTKNRCLDNLPGKAPFACWHPGVILAVDEYFSGKAHLWAEESVELADGTIGPSTIWDNRLPKVSGNL